MQRCEQVKKSILSTGRREMRSALQKTDTHFERNEKKHVMNKKWMTSVFVLAAILMVGACTKKMVPVPPLPPPSPPAPTASLSANPNTLEKVSRPLWPGRPRTRPT